MKTVTLVMTIEVEVDDDTAYVAMDKDGEWLGYSHKPKPAKGKNYWTISDREGQDLNPVVYSLADEIASYYYPNWKQSLIKVGEQPDEPNSNS